jgi:Uma2 family endonuclease
MNLMTETPELIEAPLSREELAVRYAKLCEDPWMAKVEGKVEIDAWGRVMMTPPPAYLHGWVQGRLIQVLGTLGGGHVAAESPIATATGVFAADITWASDAFVRAHAGEVALQQAPELCIEVVSPSNSRKELTDKRNAYLASGAREVWIVYPKSRRCEFYGPQGRMERSAFPVDLSSLFNQRAT